MYTSISRQSLTDGTIQKLARERDGDESSVLTDEELLTSRRAFFPDDYSDDVWVFGYGSLIWNPAIEITEKTPCRIFGHHRRFCLQTTIGRGSPEKPGLILGLDQGGSCQGIAMKINPKSVIAEIDLLWRREMINESYRPCFVKGHTEVDRIIKAFTFVIDRKSPSYVEEMSLNEKVDIIANASGFIGTSLEYLEKTYRSLRDHGIEDAYLKKIYQKICAS